MSPCVPISLFIHAHGACASLVLYAYALSFLPRLLLCCAAPVPRWLCVVLNSVHVELSAGTLGSMRAELSVRNAGRQETWSGEADFIMQVVRRMQLFSCIGDLLVIGRGGHCAASDTQCWCSRLCTNCPRRGCLITRGEDDSVVLDLPKQFHHKCSRTTSEARSTGL